MPKRSTEDYDNDDGFVEDAPVSKSKSSASKKQRLSSNKANASSSTSGGGGGGELPGGGHRSKDGEYWEISGKRRLQLSTFSGKQMVNIREYYESKDREGEMLPGKKGISLTIEQFDTIISLLPAVEAVLKGKGHVVLRPDYDGFADAGDAAAAGEGKDGVDDDDDDEDEDEDDGDDGDSDEEEKGRGGAKKSRKKDHRPKEKTGRKKNFEDTSEDE